VIAAGGLPVNVAARVLDVSSAGYYDWRSRAPAARTIRHSWLTEQIAAVHAASRGVYGARRVHAELVQGHGISVGHNAVEMLMRRAGIKGLPGSRRPRPKHQTPTAADLIDRAFARPARDQLWVTDITEHPTREGKLYCAVVLDAHSRRVVGWSIDATQTAALVTNALDMAIRNRQPAPGLVIHSDHGVQAVHLLDLHRTRRGLETGPLDGFGRGLLRQRGHRIVLGPDADRTAQPAPLEDPHRAGERDLRVPRDLPQPPTPSLRPRHAQPHRVRTPNHPRPTRSLTQAAQQPDSGKPRAHHLTFEDSRRWRRWWMRGCGPSCC
jgi:putative transposase